MKNFSKIKLAAVGSLLVTSFSLVSVSSAFAAPQAHPIAQVQSFLDKLVNNYSGVGTTQENYGTVSSTQYSLDLKVTSADGTYLFDKDSTTNDLHSEDTLKLQVSGSTLFFSNDFMPNTPASIDASNDTTLDFHLNFVDAYGRPLIITYDITLNGKNLEMHRTSAINGTIVSDDDFKVNGF